MEEGDFDYLDSEYTKRKPTEPPLNFCSLEIWGRQVGAIYFLFFFKHIFWYRIIKLQSNNQNLH